MIFPLLNPPSQMGPEDSLLLFSGPSVDDFNMKLIKRTGVKIFAVGTSYRYIKPDYWVVGDFSRGFQFLREEPHHTRDLPIMAVKAVKEKIESREQVESGPITEIINPIANATPLVALHAADQVGSHRIYLLGMDGGANDLGLPRRKVHAKRCVEAFDIDGHLGVSSLEILLYQVLDSLTRKRPDIFDRMVNLSATSSLKSLIGIDKEVALQPFGDIDRYGQCLYAKCGRSPRVQKDFAHRLRQRNRNMAIIVQGSEQEGWPVDTLFWKGPWNNVQTSNFSSILELP